MPSIKRDVTSEVPARKKIWLRALETITSTSSVSPRNARPSSGRALAGTISLADEKAVTSLLLP